MKRILVLVIGIARLGGGLVAYVGPGLFARHSSLPEAASSIDSRYVARLFGARDIVLGAFTLAGPARREALWAGAFCDCLDTTSAALARREGKDARWARGAGAVTALFALAGIVAGVGLKAEARPACSHIGDA